MIATPPPGDDWGDDRLAAAFSARAALAPPTPSDLADDVLVRVSSVDRGGRRQSWLIAAAAVVAVAVALGGGSILGEHQPGPSGSPVAGSGNPPTGEPPNAVLAALGDPVTVSEARAVPDAMQADREIVVQGFLSPVPMMYCALEPSARNPTRPRCPESHRWLMEQPEQLWGSGPGSSPGTINLGRPTGPAFHVSFDLVEAPVVPMPGDGALTPLPVVLIGHFHDRRAELCESADRQACGETFVVDRVADVDGSSQPVRTDRRTEAIHKDPEGDVDALVAVAAPDAVIASRQLVTIAQLIGIEPALQNDLVIPYVDQSKLAWLATVVDLRDRAPVARTFVLLDGSNWFAEMSAVGATMLERQAPRPSSGSNPSGPTAEPDAFASAPSSVLGMRVQSVRAVVNQREADSATDRDEYAIQAWYIGPRPGVSCDPAIAIVHAPGPPCDEARHWLLDDPQRFGVEQGQLRRDPEQWPRVLNPLLPVDVPFDVGGTWRDDVPVPQPVIVLGHFNDTRVDAYHGNVFFVVDTLAWSRDTIESLDRVTRLTSVATEDPATVVARIDVVSPNDALASWATVVEYPDFAILEAELGLNAEEFGSGPPVWIIRRLIASDRDGQARFAVETGYTVDQGTRVWWTATPDSSPDLATSIDIHDLDKNTNVLRVFDYDRLVASAEPLAGLGSLSWQRLGPVREIGLDVAHGRTANEVAVRWLGESCDATWRLEVHDAGANGIVLAPWRSGDCESGRVVRRLLIQFDRPVDLDRFRTTEPCCG